MDILFLYNNLGRGYCRQNLQEQQMLFIQNNSGLNKFFVCLDGDY